MEYQLPTEFDLIVVGTGIVESIVSAAASRIGKTVLHIDSKDYYGGLSASFNLEQIERLCQSPDKKFTNTSEEIELNKNDILQIGNDLFDLQHTTQKWNKKKEPEKIPEANIEENKLNNENIDANIEKNEPNNANIDVNIEKSEPNNENSNELSENSKTISNYEKLLTDMRKFNIDIAPKLQFAKGDLVDLLISSNIARYSEYRSVSRVLTWLNDQLEVVPCSRSDVFSNTKVSVIEKRMLMKLLATCMNSDEDTFKNYENKTFLTYLKDQKLTENLIHYVLYAIAMCTNDSLCQTGVENVRRFLNSLGRFGKTPFLYSMYGSGELSQAFCRLSAVFGGVYALNQNLNGLVFDADGKFKSVICGKQEITAQHLVMGVEYSPLEFVKTIEPTYISRAIFITDRSIMDSEKEHLTLLLYPSKNGKQICTILELGTLTGTCPKGYFIVHMFTKQQRNPQEDLEECVSKLFKNDNDDLLNIKPEVLWSFYYSMPDINNVDLRENLPENLFLCPGPDNDLDMDLSIKKAKDIYNTIYPDLEFLPRAPDPEDIIIGGELNEEEGSSDTQENDEHTEVEQNEE